MNPPERMSFDSADAILSRGAGDGVFSHSVYGVAIDGVTVAEGAFGSAGLSSVFDVASLTKPLSTATLILQLAQRGDIAVNQSVGALFEDAYGPLPHLAGVTIHHLLTHTSGLPAIPAWQAGSSREEMIAGVLAQPVVAEPGQVYKYSDTGYILLGEIARRVTGRTLDELFAERVAGVLGLERLRYRPPADWKGVLVPTTADVPVGAVHDPRARDLGGVAGHAGLFGTARDVLACAENIRAGGGRVLSTESVATMAASQISADVGGMSYGWFCAGNPYRPAGDLFSDAAYGHSGFTGTLALIDPAADAAVVLLTNRVWNEAESNARFLALRREWLNAVAEAIQSSLRR